VNASPTHPTVAIAVSPEGTLEGWTSCCAASVTYHDATLCCKACWHAVAETYVRGADGARLYGIVHDVLLGEMTPDAGVESQRELLGWPLR